MKTEEILKKLENLSNSRTRTQYINYGVPENLIYGVPAKDLKPIAKEFKNNNALAMALFKTKNYDAMYLAGMIVDVPKLTKADFEGWLEDAYFWMIASYIIAVSLAESPFALELASEWIKSSDEMKQLAGWYTYTWVLGYKKDSEIDQENIQSLLNEVIPAIKVASNLLKEAIESFVVATGISYLPLHQAALEVAGEIAEISENSKAKASIEKAVSQNRLGFKRKNVRC